MAKRGKPGATRVSMGSMPESPAMDKHEGMLSEMHDALYQLGDKIRTPFGGRGSKLLPKKLRSNESPEAQTARKHIVNMHTAMKNCGE